MFRLPKEICMFSLTLFIACFFSSVGTAEGQRQSDFSFNQKLEVSPGGAIFRVEIPEGVYQHSYYDSLRDLRVFNSDGEAVPHSFYWKKVEPSSEIIRRGLKFFPIEGMESARNDNSEILFNEGPSGASVRVTMRGKKKSSNLTTIGYLIDLRGESMPLSALTLEWATDHNNATVAVNLSASNDLKNWESLGESFTIAHFDFNGESLVKDKIEWSAQTPKFIRINAPGERGFKVRSIAGDFILKKSQSLERKVVIATQGKTEDGAIYFEKSAFNVDRVKFELEDLNSLARVDVYSRSDQANLNWTKRLTTSVYRIAQNGKELSSGYEQISSTSDRFWKVVRIGKESMSKDLRMKVKFEGPVKYLYFLAKGNAPFHLAYGNAIAENLDSGLSALADIITLPNEADFQPQEASASGAEVQISTPANGDKSPIVKQTDWRKYGLWAVLSIAVILSGLMAWKLYAEMNQSSK